MSPPSVCEGPAWISSCWRWKKNVSGGAGAEQVDELVLAVRDRCGAVGAAIVVAGEDLASTQTLPLRAFLVMMARPIGMALSSVSLPTTC